jgi:hypothetical protein
MLLSALVGLTHKYAFPLTFLGVFLFNSENNLLTHYSVKDESVLLRYRLPIAYLPGIYRASSFSQSKHNNWFWIFCVDGFRF